MQKIILTGLIILISLNYWGQSRFCVTRQEQNKLLTKEGFFCLSSAVSVIIKRPDRNYNVNNILKNNHIVETLFQIKKQ